MEVAGAVARTVAGPTGESTVGDGRRPSESFNQLTIAASSVPFNAEAGTFHSAGTEPLNGPSSRAHRPYPLPAPNPKVTLP